MIRVFIGCDAREAAAFGVLAHGIWARASAPASIAPLMLSALGGVFTRERHPLQSTDFAFSRFLVPHPCGYEGFAIFMDCDMLVRDDIAALWRLRDERCAVQVVRHDHRPRETVKFLGQPQTAYPKKNWSCVMLFDNARCRALSAEYVNTASGLELHRFKWLADEALIGALPHGWNHLVGYDAYDPQASLVHFTIGGPYFDECRDCDYAAEWFAAREAMLAVERRGGAP